MNQLTEEQKSRLRLLIADLRSGKSLQGKGALRRSIFSIQDDDSHVEKIEDCCLGRACEIFREHSGEKSEWKHEEFFVLRDDGQIDFSSATVLPFPVAKWFGLYDANASEQRSNPILISPDGERIVATEANDTALWTFPKIADAFERTYIPEDVK